ncbi:glycoside hydrolase family 43 protein [Shewanella sp. WXL01]|uniref:glycoside hydrolase family 43 protein n=1 Tax=Shewanella sp. WXL01 TaxID=2709721 RepID=UPI00143836FE|nr:glycoside hydrolase family 43 protein [Shewanella sp. WXL01]NKF51408.1 glycoside hydrolase family 43 protein [Shewanella sp. WXL01]
MVNPILPGFHPDPSIVRVGEDYYVAVSTFEWYPGVQIYHSTDLVNWQLVARPLNRAALLDMRGAPDSCGVWAPCLSYDNGKFYLIYTDVKRFDGNFKDTPNYLTCCDTIDGEWSEPVYLNSSGFDPSLFHDDDGKKWLLNMIWDHRPDRTFFGGIVLQQYDEQAKALVGERKLIFKGSELGFTEGPHLYRHNGYYYLLTAEGGTGYNHACTMARSKSIFGPYELDPNDHIVTSKDAAHHPLQRNGHGDIVQDEQGNWYLVHLTSRPLANGRSPLGRESAIEAIRYTDDGWFRLASEGQLAQLTPPGLTSSPARDYSHYEDFSGSQLPQAFQWLRTPYPENFYRIADSKLILKGKQSLGNSFEQALIARRQQHFNFTAQTCVSFYPDSFQQQAGLVCYYNSHKFHYLYLSFDEQLGFHLDVMSCLGDQSLSAHFPIFDDRIAIERGAKIHLKAVVAGMQLEFAYSLDGNTWHSVAKLDYSIISDEAGKGEGANFTGAFVGMCCQDLTGRDFEAEFDYFSYQEDHA